MEVKGLEILSDERVGEGGHLVLRRLRLRMVRTDGSHTKEGSWDFVERPMGLDAVVLALWRRAGAQVEVLLRAGVRVPMQLGREHPPAQFLFPELVAGIVEPGEDSEEALRKRAADEALEEAGLPIDPAQVQRLSAPMFPTPGMCAELFHFFSCEVPAGLRARPPEGDGSPFEEGARVEWRELGEALAACGRGEIQDLKTELGLRRLRDALA